MLKVNSVFSLLTLNALFFSFQIAPTNKVKVLSIFGRWKVNTKKIITFHNNEREKKNIGIIYDTI